MHSRKTQLMEYINILVYLILQLILYKLKEIKMIGGIFTWSNKQDTPFLVKLDSVGTQILVNSLSLC